MISNEPLLFYSFKYLFNWLILTPLDFPSAERQRQSSVKSLHMKLHKMSLSFTSTSIFVKVAIHVTAIRFENNFIYTKCDVSQLMVQIEAGLSTGAR